MAIRISRSAHLINPTGVPLPRRDGSRVSMSFLTRIEPPFAVDGTFSGDLFQWTTGFAFSISHYSSVNQQVRMTINTRAGTDYRNDTIQLPVGVTLHIAATFDKDDPSKRAFYVNGLRTSIPLVTSNPFNIGGRPRAGWLNSATLQHFSIQDVLVLTGYCLTEDDVSKLMNDSTASATIGGDAVQMRTYWSLRGEHGQAPKAGDPGLTAPDVPNFSLVPETAGEGSLIYEYPLMVKQVVGIGEAFVRSSGKGVSVPFINTQTGGSITPSTSAPMTVPSFRINNGPPIAFQPYAPVGASYIDGACAGAYLAFPAGVEVSPDDSVTLAAAQNWFATQLGGAMAVDDVPIANRAGRPSAYPDWPRESVGRIGTNLGVPTCTYFANYLSAANLAKYVALDGVNPPLRPNGTPTVNTSPIMLRGGNSIFDRLGTPIPTGNYLVRWDDLSPGGGTELAIGGFGGFSHVEELTQYANPGDKNGRGKVRVFKVDRANWNSSLAEGINATETTIRLSGGLSGFSVAGGAGVFTYLTLGDEQIRVLTYNATSQTITSCERGWNGTRATAHDAGSPARLLYSATGSDFGIRLVITGPGGEPNYENAGVLAPGDWDEPAKAGPVVMPPIPWDKLNRELEAILKSGCGVLRTMDATAVASSTAWEVEHVKPYEAEHWLPFRQFIEHHVKEAREFDPGASPYCYLYYPEPTAELYTATLANPILTRPPSGTREIITISDGPTAVVIEGTRLFSNGETMRVIRIIRDTGGTQFEIERGAGRTRTSRHAAGPITVGWRIPLNKASRYTKSGYHPIEVELADTGSLPHYGATLRSNGVPMNANPSADIPFTITAAVRPSATTIPISIAQEHWQYLAPDLEMLLGDEVLTVVSVDPSAGNVVVQPRSSASGETNAPSYTNQTRGTFRSRRVLLRDSGGRAALWKDFFGASTTLLPTGQNTALTHLRIYDSDPKVSGLYATQKFDPAVAKNSVEANPGSGYPYEFPPSITSKLDDCWHWLNIPLLASNELVDYIAVATRDNLKPRANGKPHVVIVELSNEVWNSMFRALHRLMGLYTLSDHSNYVEQWVRRSKEVCDIIKAVFAEHGRESEVLLALPWQTTNVTAVPNACRSTGVVPDSMGMAPYAAAPPHESYRLSALACDDEQACDLFTHWHQFGRTGGLGLLAPRLRQAVEAYEAEVGQRVMVTYYEGGPDAVLPGYSSSEDTARRTRDLTYNPSFYHLKRDLDALSAREGRCEAYAQFTFAHRPANMSQQLWGLKRGITQKPGYGDGRDGSTDNRLTRFRRGVPGSADLLTDPDAVNDAVRLQAWIDECKDFTALYGDPNPNPNPNPNPDPDPDPDDDRVHAKARLLPIPRSRRFRRVG